MTRLYRDGKCIELRNSGWLLRHWKEVTKLGFNYFPCLNGDGELIGYTNKATFIEDWKCLHILWHWLNRPIFKGLNFCFVYKNLSDAKLFIIGNDEWTQIQELDYFKFKEYINKLTQ